MNYNLHKFTKATGINPGGQGPDGCALVGLCPDELPAAAANPGPTQKEIQNRSSSVFDSLADWYTQTTPPHVLATLGYP